ncbi:MAG: nickel pincer cofactor biosynthesis protein LarB [Dehalococcoidia bacterium]|nr:nickel pincer cofactor biosynthesis protein LarB [Dehalococcoidia bacterium]
MWEINRKDPPIDTGFIEEILRGVKDGSISLDEAMDVLRKLPYEDLVFAKPDHHRALRQGFPEVILAKGKSPGQVAEIASHLKKHNDRVMITKAGDEVFQAVKRVLNSAIYNEAAGIITFKHGRDRKPLPGVLVVSGGTADIPVAEEAAITAEEMGNEVERAYDVGVAGIHRLLDKIPQLRKAHVIVAVAGMEGALPSVISGLISVPVIAVPTSTGYGASFNGIAPLLSMLNSCAAGVSVVNIDNGFGAGYVAALINRAFNQRGAVTRTEKP